MLFRSGEVVNEATAEGTSPDPENPDVPVTPGTTEDQTEEPDGHITITKETTSTTPEGGYALGDTISYKITVKNDGNLTITDITVTDELTDDEWTIASLAPNASEEFTASYTVTEADVLAGSVVNEATATGTSPDPDEPEVPVTPGTKEDPTEDPNGHINITKETTSTPADGEAYVLGETVSYRITVKNDGNLTITDITVTDDLTNDEWTIASLAPNASETFTASYTVTEKDILAGSVVNEATATGTSPDPDEPKVPVTPGTKEDPTEDPNGHINITKETTSTPADGEAYVLGETVSYRITVKNDGNLTITDITVTDDLTGDEWTIASLAPEASVIYTAEHDVTEADILAGKVVNEATATGTSPDPDEPKVPVTPGTKEDPTEDPNGHITISKVTTSTPANGSKYGLGETITYKITATNDGNLTITDITVKDDLTGDKWTIASLAPGESRDFAASYIVKESDLGGQVVNVATADGTSPDPDKPDVPVTPGEDPEPTADKRPALTVTKTGSAASGLTAGDTITYTVVVENTGNVTLDRISLDDSLVNVANTARVTAPLAPGATRTITYRYTVTAADAAAGSVVNTAIVTGTTNDGLSATGRDSFTAATTAGGGGGGGPVVPDGGGGGPNIVPDDGGAPADDGVPIDDEPVPEVEPEVIDDDPVPLAGAWALINLICAALATVGAVIELFRRRKEDEEDEENEDGEAKDKNLTKDEDEDDEEARRKRNLLIAKTIGVIAAVASIIAFILTEDMRLPMIMTDRWTLLMALLFGGQIASAVAAKQAADDDDDEAGNGDAGEAGAGA